MASHCLLEGRRESLLKEQEAFADLVVVELLVCSEDESCEFSDVRF